MARAVYLLSYNDIGSLSHSAERDAGYTLEIESSVSSSAGAASLLVGLESGN